MASWKIPHTLYDFPSHETQSSSEVFHCHIWLYRVYHQKSLNITLSTTPIIPWNVIKHTILLHSPCFWWSLLSTIYIYISTITPPLRHNFELPTALSMSQHVSAQLPWDHPGTTGLSRPSTTLNFFPSVGSCFMISGESKMGCRYIHASICKRWLVVGGNRGCLG